MKLFEGFFPPHVLVLFNDRSLDGRLKEQGHGLTPVQQAYFEGLAGFSIPRVFNIRQIHGNAIVTLTENSTAPDDSVPQADGVITNLPRQPLVVRIADCLPVVMFDPRNRCLGLVHAGWKGTQKRILAQAVLNMNSAWGSRAEDLLIGFGPCIRTCCYEVGAEFKDRFPGRVARRQDRYYFDLARANKDILFECGVSPGHLKDCGLCTCCAKEFFSYRRQGEKAGRHICLALFKNG